MATLEVGRREEEAVVAVRLTTRIDQHRAKYSSLYDEGVAWMEERYIGLPKLPTCDDIVRVCTVGPRRPESGNCVFRSNRLSP